MKIKQTIGNTMERPHTHHCSIQVNSEFRAALGFEGASCNISQGQYYINDTRSAKTIINDLCDVCNVWRHTLLKMVVVLSCQIIACLAEGMTQSRVNNFLRYDLIAVSLVSLCLLHDRFNGSQSVDVVSWSLKVVFLQCLLAWSTTVAHSLPVNCKFARGAIYQRCCCN